MNPRARLDYSHLHALTGPYGTFEHAQFASPRVKHGYCTDDVARVLLVASREPHPDADLIWLARSSLDFLAAAQPRFQGSLLMAVGVENQLHKLLWTLLLYTYK